MLKQNKHKHQKQSKLPEKPLLPQLQTNTKVVWWERFRASLTTQEFWYNLLLAVLIFTAPTNLFYKFWEGGSYVHGLQIDYLIGKVYLSQIPLLILLGSWLSDRNTWKNLFKYWKKTNSKFLILLFLALGVRQLFTPEPIVSLWQWFTLGTVGLLGFFLHVKYKTLHTSVIPWALTTTMMFQSIVGLSQFALQHELVGYQLLGEPTLTDQLGITTTILAGAERILPYGTTAHPNVLAGFLAVYALLLLRTSRSKLYSLPIILLGTITLFITTSISGVLTLCFGIILMVLPNNILPSSLSQKVLLILLAIAVPIIIAAATTTAPKNLSLVRRAYLQQSGLRIFAQFPVLGTGLQTITRSVEKYSPSQEVVRFTQPPHHVGITLLAEAGMLGCVLLIFVLKNNPMPELLTIAPALLLDHYMWTVFPGILLVSLFVAITATQTKPDMLE